MKEVLMGMMIAATAVMTSLVGTAQSGIIFQDLALEHGFRLSAVRSSMTPVEVGAVLALNVDSSPSWRLAQWGTNFTLASAEVVEEPHGARSLSNAGKRVRVLSGGLAGDGVELTVYGSREYGGNLRKQGESWPHLLIEQKLDDISPAGLGALRFSVRFQIDRCDAATDEELDPALHTAHINAFWTIHNTNPESRDYRDMIWFGLPLFDIRYPVPPGHQALDVGQEDASGKFICTIPGERFYDAPVEVGRPQSLDCDLLPLIDEALAASQKHGFMQHTSVGDLALTSFNLGWEVPGPYDCTVRLWELGLRAVASEERP